MARSRAPVGHQYLPGQIVPITLMFQRLMGGARIDETAATEVPGLFAAGESSGGVHGGDRMQGCGFLETQVFGGIAGQSAAALAARSGLVPLDPEAIAAEAARLAGRRSGLDPAELVRSIQTLMWEQAGVVSNRPRLLDAIAKLRALREDAAGSMRGDDPFAAEEAANLALTAEMVARAKLAREETRSGHGRTDFPEADEAWVKHVRLARTEGDEIQVGEAPVVLSAEPAGSRAALQPA